MQEEKYFIYQMGLFSNFSTQKQKKIEPHQNKEKCLF